MFDPLRVKARVIATISLGFVGGLGLASALGWTGPTYAMPAIAYAPQLSEEAIRPAMALSDAFADVAESVTPAVVRIEVTSTRRVSRTQMEIPEQFRRFFDIPEGQDMQEHPEVPSMGGGSGFILSQDGYILTNDHVVADADNIRVYLTDGRYFDAELVGTDPTTDVAVIKINTTGLSYLSLGSSEDLRVGEWVLAIGNPGFGGAPEDLDYTVTAGIVSAKGRPLRLIAQGLQQNPGSGVDAAFAIEDYIQTDAVINRGNSGGPMVNLRGQVVGINSAIMTPTGYYAGYGFAIPVDLAGRVMEDLIEYGRVRRAWLGVSIVAVAPEDQEYYNLPGVAGVLVQDITAGSPAADAGLQRGDVIYSVEGTVVYSPNGLQNHVAQRKPRDQVTVRIYRDGSPRDIQLRLGEAPLTAEPAAAAAEPEPPAAEEKLGLAFGTLTEELNQRMGFDEAGGVVVTDVRALGPASRRGIGPGMKILEINGAPVDTPDDVNRLLKDVNEGDIVSLLMGYAGGAERIINVRAGG